MELFHLPAHELVRLMNDRLGVLPRHLHDVLDDHRPSVGGLQRLATRGAFIGIVVQTQALLGIRGFDQRVERAIAGFAQVYMPNSCSICGR